MYSLSLSLSLSLFPHLFLLFHVDVVRAFESSLAARLSRSEEGRGVNEEPQVPWKVPPLQATTW